MEIVAFLLAIVAIVLFLVTALGAASRVNLLALGLACLGSAWIVQLLTSARQVHF